MLLKQIEAALHAGKHSQAQHIHLHELEDVDVVLVPFDDLPILHRGRFDRHQFIAAVLSEYEPAWMLGTVTRRADQLLGQIESEP